MDERYSRLEKNKNLYISNDDHKFVVFYYFILLPIILIVSFFLLLTDVHATDSYEITSNVHPGQSCSGSTNLSSHICVRGDFGESSYSAFEIGSNADINASANIYAIQFYTYTSIAPTSYYTIKIEGTSFANTSYSCQLSTYTSSCRVVYVNSTRLNVNFTASGTTSVSNLQVLVTANNIFNTNSQWKVTHITLLSNPIDNTGSSGGTSGSTFDDSGIINNQNENTQQIIDNANQNAQDTISSINNFANQAVANHLADLNQKRQEVSNTCKNVIYSPLGLGKTFNTSGSLVNTSGAYYTIDKVDILTSYGTKLWVQNPRSSSSGYYILFYNDNDQVLDYWRTATRTITIPTGATYFKFATTDNTTIVLYGSGSCVTSQDEMNDLIKDDSVDQNQANNYFTDFDDDDNGGISAIITRPLMIINNLLSNNSSCSNLNLPNIMGATNAYLPSGCILWDNAPSEVITLWNTLIIGLGSYFILRDLYKTIHDLKDPDNDKVEVMDL